MSNPDYLNSVLENEQLLPLDVRRQLQSPSPWQRSEGVEHISYLPWSVAGPVLEAMGQKDPHWDVRLHVACALQHYAPELSNPLLEKMVEHDHDPGVRESAHESMRLTARRDMNGRDGVAKLREDFARYPDPVKEGIMNDVLNLVKKLNGNGVLDKIVTASGPNGNGKAKTQIAGPAQAFKAKA